MTALIISLITTALAIACYHIGFARGLWACGIVYYIIRPFDESFVNCDGKWSSSKDDYALVFEYKWQARLYRMLRVNNHRNSVIVRCLWVTDRNHGSIIDGRED